MGCGRVVPGRYGAVMETPDARFPDLTGMWTHESGIRNVISRLPDGDWRWEMYKTGHDAAVVTLDIDDGAELWHKFYELERKGWIRIGHPPLPEPTVPVRKRREGRNAVIAGVVAMFIGLLGVLFILLTTKP